MMRYSPRSLVTVLRTFSMSTGLETSTVTPGSTAPYAYATTTERLAALVPCPDAVVGMTIRHSAAKATLTTRPMADSFSDARTRRTAVARQNASSTQGAQKVEE